MHTHTSNKPSLQNSKGDKQLKKFREIEKLKWILSSILKLCNDISCKSVGFKFLIS